MEDGYRIVHFYFDPSFDSKSRSAAISIFMEFEDEGGCVRFYEVDDPDEDVKKLLISTENKKCHDG